jgi:small subunit ribosomal protein S17
MGSHNIQVGRVVSDKMDKTIVVTVDRYKPHPKYHKSIRLSKKFYAHDEMEEAQIGDLVEIVESRPLSKTKRWRLHAILRRPDLKEALPKWGKLTQLIQLAILDHGKSTMQMTTQETYTLRVAIDDEILRSAYNITDRPQLKVSVGGNNIEIGRAQHILDKNRDLATTLRTPHSGQASIIVAVSLTPSNEPILIRQYDITVNE